MRKYKAAFVMEAATMSLGAWLGIHGPCFDAGLASAWSSQLASALAHVHGQGVVHRDVKPANCLVCLGHSELGQAGPHLAAAIKLADFGSARTLPERPRCKIGSKRPCFFQDHAHSMDRLFEMTALVVTSCWRALELLGNTVTADKLEADDDMEQMTMYGASVDVWSYGATVYEILTGEHLAGASSGAGLL